MRLKDQPESKNVIDDSGMSALTRLFYKSMAQEDQRVQDSIEDMKSVGGYSNWLTHALNDLSPQERQLMQKHGFSLQDIYTLRSFNTAGGNPTVKIYR